MLQILSGVWLRGFSLGNSGCTRHRLRPAGTLDADEDSGSRILVEVGEGVSGTRTEIGMISVVAVEADSEAVEEEQMVETTGMLGVVPVASEVVDKRIGVEVEYKVVAAFDTHSFVGEVAEDEEGLY